MMRKLGLDVILCEERGFSTVSVVICTLDPVRCSVDYVKQGELWELCMLRLRLSKKSKFAFL
jgi:hypothetical protein